MTTQKSKKIANNFPKMRGKEREGSSVERHFSRKDMQRMRQKSVASPPSTRTNPRSIRPGISPFISLFRSFCTLSYTSPSNSKRKLSIRHRKSSYIMHSCNIPFTTTQCPTIITYFLISNP